MGIEARRNPPIGAIKPEPPSAPPIKSAAEQLAIDLLANFEQNKLSCQVLAETAYTGSLPSAIHKHELNEQAESWERAIDALRIVARKHGITLPIQAAH